VFVITGHHEDIVANRREILRASVHFSHIRTSCQRCWNGVAFGGVGGCLVDGVGQETGS